MNATIRIRTNYFLSKTRILKYQGMKWSLVLPRPLLLLLQEREGLFVRGHGVSEGPGLELYVAALLQTLKFAKCFQHKTQGEALRPKFPLTMPKFF
jgi:hypothetical protein